MLNLEAKRHFSQNKYYHILRTTLIYLLLLYMSLYKHTFVHRNLSFTNLKTNKTALKKSQNPYPPHRSDPQFLFISF